MDERKKTKQRKTKRYIKQVLINANGANANGGAWPHKVENEECVRQRPEWLLQPTQAQVMHKRLKSSRHRGVLRRGPRPGPLALQAR